MVKFSDVNAQCNSKEAIEKFRDIKPKEIVSDQEIDNFWDSEFNFNTDESEDALLDRLFSEVFCRSEDEITIDFDIDNEICSLLDEIQSSEWSDADDSFRISKISELLETVGERLGLSKVPTISLYYEENEEYGNYDYMTNEINLNTKYMADPRMVVNTLMHELRHAYQHERADILETKEDLLYRVNFDNYISPIPLANGNWLLYTDYQDQYVEVEARVFADMFTEAMNS